MPRLVSFLFAFLLAASFAGAAVDRVLRKFDFEERAAGNLEDIPMDWVKVEGTGLPHYVNGALTTDEAVSGQYAFGFTLDGGSLIYRYPAGKIKIAASGHYRIGAMVKTRGLVNARAQLTAYCTDAKGTAIKTSIIRSAPQAATEWTPVQIDLTAPEGSASLVLELGLLQPALWRTTSLGEAALNEQDITGQAWFDDLTITQVPRVSVQTTAAGNVFRRGDTVTFDVHVNDRLTRDLVGRLEVRDADGALVHQQSGDFDLRPDGVDQSAKLVLPNLPAGWYRGTVSFESDGIEVGRQSVAYIQLADNAAVAPPDSRFGVIATDLPATAWDDLPRLLPMLGVSHVKIAVWDKAGDVDRVGRPQFNRLLDRLAERQITPTACVIAAPPDIATRIGGAGLSQFARSSPDVWRPTLALTMSRYAGHLDRWQFGSDDQSADFAANSKLRDAYAPMLATMTDLFSPPDLSMPWPVFADPPVPAPAALALDVPGDVLPQHLPLYVNDAVSKGPTRISLTLRPLPVAQYGRAAQVRDLAQRIGFAVASGAQRIDLPMPFISRNDVDAIGREPTDTYLVERTMMTALAGTKYQGRMPLGDDVEALLFDRDGDGVLLAWMKSPQAAAKKIAVMLGESPRTIDLNGNVSPVLKPRSADGTTDVTVGPVPVLIIGVDGALARLRSSFAFDNPLLESSFKPHVRKLHFTNPYPTPLSGKLKIAGPGGWTLLPQTPAFNLAAGATYDGVVTVEFPYSSLAGMKTIDVDVQIDGGAAFKVPLTMRLGLGDLGVESSAFRDGADVVVQQLITNYSDKPADYTAFAAYPGAARQERIIRGLTKGTTVIKRYRFTNVGDSKSKTLRSGVRETEGTRSLNEEITLP